MKSIYIDDELHRRWKLKAAALGVPLRLLIEGHLRTGAGASDHPARAPGVSTAELVAAAAGGGAFDFWEQEEEDIYHPGDGRPVK